MPAARWIRGRVDLLNRTLREVCGTTGAILVDVARHPVASDPRLWSEDRLHANALGHQRIAAALAEALSLDGADSTWRDPLPPAVPMSGLQHLAAEARWARRHLFPWIWRHLHGRSSGDGRAPKRPDLQTIAQPHAPQ
jgi:hypothetical protein